MEKLLQKYGDSDMNTMNLFCSGELNVNILELDNVKLTKNWKAENIRSSFTRVYVVTSGTGWLRFGRSVIKMIPGYVYIVPAGLKFSYDCVDGFSKIYFHIAVKLQSGYDAFEGFTKCLALKDRDAADFINNCTGTYTVTNVMNLKSWLYSVVHKCMEQRENTEIVKYSDYVAEIMSYTEKNLSANLTVEKIANALFTSAAKIRKVFKAETGITIGKYIDDCLMFAAELDVRCKDLSIRQISENLGFCDQFYFSRCFARHYGLSPLKYRKEQIYK